MPQSIIYSHSHKIRQSAIIGCLILLFSLIFSATALADAPADEAAGQCIDCHPDETAAWQASPHAEALNHGDSADCQTCHGDYANVDHENPENCRMELKIDSAACSECHETTYTEWQNTTHSDAGVECIGCHQSHSQQFRLTDENQCSTCHRERQADMTHTAHGAEGVTCIDCHLSSTMSGETAELEPDIALINNRTGQFDIAFVSNGLQSDGPRPVPSHDFTQVTADNCIECHQGDVHTGLPNSTQIADVHVVEMAERVPDLTAKLETAQQENKSLLIMTPVSLGIGIGLGGVLGIIFMLIVGSLNRRRGEQ